MQERGNVMSDPRIEIYENHKQAIYSYLYRSTLNRHIAEDLTQETFFGHSSPFPIIGGKPP
ncbi:hypothetical protein C4588_05960 [Candidatus Parcubacteria bacterium]|nr:MAG: hypothetical protein C4588_05960 [Candidatus Parcubacteria bacterium]